MCLQQTEYGRSQFRQRADDVAPVRQQSSNGRMPDADAANLHTEPDRAVDGQFTGTEGIRYAVRQDKQDLSLFRLGLQRLKDMPEGRPQRRAACGMYGKTIRHALAVPQQREDIVRSASCGKGRDGGIDAPDAVQGDSNGKAGLPRKAHGLAGHAAAAVQQDMYRRIQGGPPTFRKEQPGVPRGDTVQAAAMQAAMPSRAAAPCRLRLQQTVQTHPKGLRASQGQ